MVQITVRLPSIGGQADIKDELSEWAILEMQGHLVSKEGTLFGGKYIGDLHYTKSGVPILLVGHHVLYGKEQAMDKPVLVMKKVVQSEVVSDSDEKTNVEYQVQAVIKKKLVFRTRPKPIITNQIKKF
ncbi:chromosome transmission fidelity protein 8 homolog isoform X2 [Ornithodoros turicata]|uniref:chromosome transmission fidelity protein 8 homolog isoform X1 n=1 Tax=Ornithodoros turicata TaxID=34597 RepID=UPI003139328D